MLEDCLEARFEFLTGCKIALICEGQILTILRDDKKNDLLPQYVGLHRWWSGRK